jgi:hypothetical protein
VGTTAAAPQKIRLGYLGAAPLLPPCALYSGSVL